MTEYAQIKVTSHVIEPFGKKYNTYEWLGSKSLPVELDLFLLEDEKLPWELIEIKKDYSTRRAEYIRKDVLLPFGFLSIVKVKISNIFKFIYYRSIVTLMVWGLAYTPLGCVPSWRDIGRKAE